MSATDINIQMNCYTRKNNKVFNFFRLLTKDIAQNKEIYLMMLPGLVFYLIYYYWPIYGAVIAFKDFNPVEGIMGSKWVGLKYFQNFFESVYFFRVLKNTILINVYSLLWGFPAPIILALLLNEVRNSTFKRLVQTVTYIPHFISIMVICGLIVNFTAKNGLVNDIIALFGGTRSSLLTKAELFRTIFISTDIWKELGWGTIIYLSALTGIDAEQYEAAKIDGAGRFKQLIHVTLPGIMPTIIILLILRMGQMMNVGFEKIILLYNPAIYETSDVISSFIYRKGILEANYSFSTAVGLFNSVINFTLLMLSNKLSRKFNDTSLW